MIYPAKPKIVPDRDNYRNWYLDETIHVLLENGDDLLIEKGYRFDAHSVPWWARWAFPQYDTDIAAALVHDYLVDTAPWHRYNRAFIDRQYTTIMRDPRWSVSRWRSKWMPRAVMIYGYLRFTLWGDYRGDPKLNTRVYVKVEYEETIV